MTQWLQRHWRIVTATAVAVTITTAIVIWSLQPDGRYIPPARTRTTINFTVCMLTDHDGVTGTTAAPAWQGVLDAQRTTNLKAQNLAVSGSGKLNDAIVAVNTLAQRNCSLIIAAGKEETAAVAKQAAIFPKQKFLTINASRGAAQANISTITGSGLESLKTQVSEAVRRAVTT